MPEAQKDSHSWKDYDRSSDRLKASLDKLQERGDSRLKEKYGVSSDFAGQVKTEEMAMELCEKAIEALATDYIAHLTAFRQATTATQALESLENAEVVWQSEAKIIGHFDADGGESDFLRGIRQQTYTVMEDQLENAARQCSLQPTGENVALCLAILGVMDTILSELGHPTNSPERQRFRDIAKSFK